MKEKLNSINNAIEKMKQLLPSSIPKRINTFSVRTSVPYTWELLVDEWTGKEKNIKHIKTLINKELVKEIERRFGLNYSPGDGEIVFEFNFEKMRCRVFLSNLFLFGYYYKEKPNISQTRWICKKCKGKGCMHCNFKGKMYLSVEELIGERIKELFDCKDYVLHSSGREDVDVINLAGRPFVLEIIKPKNKPSLSQIQQQLEQSKFGVWCEIKGYVKRGVVRLVSDSHFDKTYWVETNGEIGEEEESRLLSLVGKYVEQRTPRRVAHRRADLIRKRKILDIRILNRTPLVFMITTEPGTYIKELVNGDEGRTNPSISSIFGKKIRCTCLRLISIHDEFLSDVLGFWREREGMEKRIERAGRASEKASKIKDIPTKIRELAKDYVKDGWYYFEKGDLLSAMACFDYAYGLIDGSLVTKGGKTYFERSI
jgi:tRNA pseudouridine synthase 10